MTGLWLKPEVCAGTGHSTEPGQGRDGLEPLVRARTGPMSELEFREVTGPGHEPGVRTETGLGISLGQDRK